MYPLSEGRGRVPHSQRSSSAQKREPPRGTGRSWVQPGSALGVGTNSVGVCGGAEGTRPWASLTRPPSWVETT